MSGEVPWPWSGVTLAIIKSGEEHFLQTENHEIVLTTLKIF